MATSVATVHMEDTNNAQRVGKFMCVVPPKTLRVNPYGIASRGEPNTALDDALSALEFQTSSQSADGGGVAISVGPAIQAFTDNEVIVSFCGHLTNVDYLAWRLFSAEGRRGDTFASNQSPVEAANKLIGGRCYEAELVCHMYKAFGTKALPKLRGQFSFACFDARTVRVFAARDPSGTYPLMYGRADDGTVVAANFQSADQLLGGDGDTGDGKYSVPLDTPNNLLSVPAGCFIYGHRGIKPQRYAKDVVEAKKQQSEASDAVANALRGLKVGRRSLDGRKSLDGGSAGSVSSGTPPQQSSWSKQSGGKSRLPWRRDSLDEQRPSPSSLSPSAKPWSAGDLSKHEGVAEDSTNSTGDSSSEHGEHEPALSEEHLSSLSGLEAHDEAHDTFSESAKVSKNLEPGTKDEHSRAETVAVKAAVAALRRVASGANMKGMVRMGSSNALHALGLNPSAAAFGSDNLSSLSGRRNSGDILGRRMSGNSDKSETSEGASNFAIHRVPSRSGLISSMVKVASFGNLGGLQHVGSLNDLRHAAKEKKKKEKDDDDETDDAWADMTLLVISNNASGGQP